MTTNNNKKRVNFADSDYRQDATAPNIALLPGDMDPERQQRLADLETKFQRRRECENRAHQVVLRLVDNPITEEFLKDAAQLIHTSHYTDVTEERAIDQLCGYPLCPKPLPKQPKKKYHISLAHKKVYDITERKNFCSNQCFKASKHFEQQISTTAIWARNKQPPVLFDILPLDSIVNPGKIGEAVITDPSAQIRSELKALEERDRCTARYEAEKRSATKKMATEQTPVEHLEEVRIDQLAQQVSDILLIGEAKDGHDSAEELAEEKSELCDADQGKALKPPTEINGNRDGVSGMANHHQGTARVRAVDPRSNDPMVPVQCPDPVCRGGNEARQVEDAINSKAKLLTALLDQRDTLQASVRSKPLQPLADNPSMTSNPDCSVISVAPRATFGASVMDNIRRATAQQEAAQNAKVKKKSRKVSRISPFVLIQKCFLAWRTTETSMYLSDHSRTHDMTEFDKKYAALGARVRDLSGFVGETGIDEEDIQLNPVPDMEQLRHDTQQLELKVHEFYKGNMRYPVVDPDGDSEEPVSSLPVEEPIAKDGERPDHDPVMPMLDAYSQTAIRRKIVFDQLNRVLPDLLRPLSLPLQDIAGDMRKLVNTFSFSATNIVLKPGEWTLIAYFLLRLLALKLPIVDAAFRVPQTEEFFATMISGLGITEQMIQTVLHDMTSPPCDDSSLVSDLTSQPTT